MPLGAVEIRNLVRARGWTFVDLAARWEVSVTWMSRLVNSPRTRPLMYDDAFRGLPLRESVEVKRAPRHIRKRKPAPKTWSPAEMFPRGQPTLAISRGLFPRRVSRRHAMCLAHLLIHGKLSPREV